MPNNDWKLYRKNEFDNGKSYIKKLYIRLQLQMFSHVPIYFLIVTQSRFR